jgi:hypothetical protein
VGMTLMYGIGPSVTFSIIFPDVIGGGGA